MVNEPANATYNKGSEAFAAIYCFLKNEEKCGHKLTDDELQKLFDPANFPDLKSSTSGMDKAAKNLLAAYYLSFSQDPTQFKKIDVHKDLVNKVKESCDMFREMENPRGIVRNGTSAAAMKSVERIATVAAETTQVYLQHPETLAKQGLAKDLAPLRRFKTTIGAVVVVAIGAEAWDAFEKGDYEGARDKMTQGLCTTVTCTKTGTKLLANGLKRLVPEGEMIASEVAEKLAAKGAIRAGGQKIPIVGAVIEECYGIYSLYKDGYLEHNWGKARGNFEVAQGGAAGALIPIPVVSFVVSEGLAEAAAALHNRGNTPDREKVNGAITITLVNVGIDKFNHWKTLPTDAAFREYIKNRRSHDPEELKFEDMAKRMLGLNSIENLIDPRHLIPQTTHNRFHSTIFSH